MKAAWYERSGSPDVLVVGEMDTPAPGPGEVLVRLYSSGVNPSDVKSRAGLRAPMAFPRIIPHSDGAGVIEAVGPGVPGDRVGQRVWVWNAQWQRPFGTAASHVALPAAQTVPLPEGTSFEAGACLGIPAVTAHRCVFADGPVTGQTVLVTGGAGAVGHYAIQLAKWGGATVIATVSGEAKAEHARSAGADHVINYRQNDVVAAIREATGGAGVDRVVEVEFGGNLAVTNAVLKPNGVIAAYGSMADPTPTLPFYLMMFNGTTIRLILLYILPDAARQQANRDVTAALKAGALKHAVAATYALDAIAEAHRAVESATLIGNVVVTID